MRHALPMCLVLVMLTASACERHSESGKETARDNSILETREARLEKSLASDDSTATGNKPVARWLLPPELSEISGLALTGDDRLFAHNDESARITEIDYRRGTILKRFYAGEKSLRGDFESITFGDNRFFLLTSNGIIYQFPEGQQGERVDCTVFDTRLGNECEFEGMAYDPGTKGLILACKNVGKKKSDELVMYRYTPGDESGISEITVPLQDVIGKNPWKQVRPTDITRDPESGNYVLVAAQEKALIELTPSGGVVFARPLAGRHPQSEGVAITHDHILIISDESVAGAATLTLYRWPLH